jgi:hypothetical protein
MNAARNLPAIRPGAVLRRLNLFIAASALALAGLAASTTPARANEDLIRFLLGAATVGLIISAIDDNRTPSRPSGWNVLPDDCRETVRFGHRVVDYYHGRCLARAGYRNLPNYCEVPIRTNRGTRRGYEAQCLFNAGYRAESFSRPIRPVQPVRPVQPEPTFGRLPANCEMFYRESGVRVAGFDGQCLRREGFRDLPRNCSVRDRSGNTYFNAACLRRAGYRTRHGS